MNSHAGQRSFVRTEACTIEKSQVRRSVELGAFAHPPRYPKHHRLSTVRIISEGNQRGLECGEPEDLDVLREITAFLQPEISKNASSRCYHIKGQGGTKATLEKIRRLLSTGNYPFVARSDAKNYYSNINHRILLEQVREYCRHSPTLRLVQQYCARTIVKNGYYHEIEWTGISPGCQLSPLMGALYLSPLIKRWRSALEWNISVSWMTGSSWQNPAGSSGKLSAS